MPVQSSLVFFLYPIVSEGELMCLYLIICAKIHAVQVNGWIGRVYISGRVVDGQEQNHAHQWH